MVMTTVVRKVGGSLMITLPKKYIAEYGIKEGDAIPLHALRVHPPSLSEFIGKYPRLGGWRQENKDDIKDW